MCFGPVKKMTGPKMTSRGKKCILVILGHFNEWLPDWAKFALQGNHMVKWFGFFKSFRLAIGLSKRSSVKKITLACEAPWKKITLASQVLSTTTSHSHQNAIWKWSTQCTHPCRNGWWRQCGVFFSLSKLHFSSFACMSIRCWRTWKRDHGNFNLRVSVKSFSGIK